MSIKKPTIHSMNRRSYYCDYSRPGVYHVTLKTAEALRHPLGKVVGDIDKPDGDPKAPHVELTPLGRMVEQELLHSIALHYPMMEVQDLLLSVSPWIYSYRLKQGRGHHSHGVQDHELHSPSPLPHPRQLVDKQLRIDNETDTTHE